MGTIFTKKQRLTLFKKIGIYVSGVLSEKQQTGELQYKEIAEMSNLHPSRVSEIVNLKTITEPQLIGLLAGGIILVKDIAENVALDEHEERFIERYSIYEGGEEFARGLLEIRRLGGDPQKIIRGAIAKLRAKKDAS